MVAVVSELSACADSSSHVPRIKKGWRLMTKKFLLIGIFLLLVLPASGWAADASGKWIAKINSNEITLVFKADGAKLTGTINNAQAAGDTPISDGKIAGNEVSFSLVRTINDNEVRVLWKGKVVGDEIIFKREIQGQEGSSTDITAKRAK
jgi:hypothetical protein